jgi:multiple sugar transport system substrate-binding protein
MSQDVNAKISSLAHGFPGNKNSTPDYVSGDPIYKAAFDIYKSGTPANEFTGLPVAEQLMRDFDDQFQLYLAGKQSIDDTLAKAQAAWVKDFAG